MYRISGTIEGVAPILFNRMADDALEGSHSGKQTTEQRIEEAMQKVYRVDGELALPSWNLKKCLIEGCAKGGLKEGRAGLGKFLEATVFITGSLLFGKTEPDFLHEVVGRIPPKTGAAAIIRRPALNAGWKLPFSFAVVDDRRNADTIRRALEEAGMLCGLGSWRPEYGRFIVTDWSVTK